MQVKAGEFLTSSRDSFVNGTHYWTFSIFIRSSSSSLRFW